MSQQFESTSVSNRSRKVGGIRLIAAISSILTGMLAVGCAMSSSGFEGVGMMAVGALAFATVLAFFRQ